MEVRGDRIQKDIERINSFNATPEKGVTRLTFSPEYEGARAYVLQEMKKIGAHVFITQAGNMRGRLEGSEKGVPVVMTGSHLDSVSQGGKYDGVVGVVAALEAGRVIVEKKIPHRHPIDLVVFAEEEGSRFGSVLAGSRAWAGKISLSDLGGLKDKNGVSYLAALKETGLVPDEEPILLPEAVKGMLEVHIEQSLVLESKGFPIGVVEAIAGIKQFLVTLSGVSNHAGGTPMGFRSDALQGAVRIIAETETIARKMSPQTVATVGYVHCEPGQANVIPGQVQFTLDIRDTRAEILKATVEAVQEKIVQVCRERGLGYQITPRSDTAPTPLSREMVALIEKKSRERGIQTLSMVSGALHDSSILAEIVPVGMIFLPSKGGRSHCPEEYTDIKEIQLGTEILLAVVAELAA